MDEIIDAEATKVTVEALAAGYRAVHCLLDGQVVDDAWLSRVSDMLAVALRVNGSSGSAAIDGLV
jgi:hypothetical protein